jgi:hypothetical protein
LKYLPLFHHFKTIYQFPKHIIFFIKIIANASLTICIPQYNNSFLHFRLASPLHRQSWWVKPALLQVGSCTYERSQIRWGNCPSSWRTVVALMPKGHFQEISGQTGRVVGQIWSQDHQDFRFSKKCWQYLCNRRTNIPGVLASHNSIVFVCYMYSIVNVSYISHNSFV